jgi:hypothetical protein
MRLVGGAERVVGEEAKFDQELEEMFSECLCNFSRRVVRHFGIKIQVTWRCIFHLARHMFSYLYNSCFHRLCLKFLVIFVTPLVQRCNGLSSDLVTEFSPRHVEDAMKRFTKFRSLKWCKL